MVQEWHRIEQVVEHNVSGHHLQVVTQMDIVAEGSMDEQRASLIAEVSKHSESVTNMHAAGT